MAKIPRSLPVWGEWIEIVGLKNWLNSPPSLPVWGEWIEISWEADAQAEAATSLPVWGEWIEMVPR